jgi:hypothetical protein
MGMGENETERPEDTVRRQARKLVRLEAMIDAELERVRKVDDLPVQWWERRRRQWVDGVITARVISEEHLWAIKSAFYGEEAPRD